MFYTVWQDTQWFWEVWWRQEEGSTMVTQGTRYLKMVHFDAPSVLAPSADWNFFGNSWAALSNEGPNMPHVQRACTYFW